MVDTAVGTIVRVRKGSRGYTYEEIMIRIPRVLWRNILSVFDGKKRRVSVVLKVSKDSLLVLPYRPPPTRERRRTG
jgi:hypothetical protein